MICTKDTTALPPFPAPFACVAGFAQALSIFEGPRAPAGEWNDVVGDRCWRGAAHTADRIAGQYECAPCAVCTVVASAGRAWSLAVKRPLAHTAASPLDEVRTSWRYAGTECFTPHTQTPSRLRFHASVLLVNQVLRRAVTWKPQGLAAEAL